MTWDGTFWALQGMRKRQPEKGRMAVTDRPGLIASGAGPGPGPAPAAAAAAAAPAVPADVEWQKEDLRR